jgi:hypothetical protein
MSPDIVVPNYGAPARVTVGADGLPDFVTATKGSPFRYVAPRGFKLVVRHNGTVLKHIVEADRTKGWAVGLHYTEDNRGRATFHPADENGVAQHRFYEGRITFRLERVAR